MLARFRIVTLVLAQISIISLIVIGILSFNLWQAVENKRTASYVGQVYRAAEMADEMAGTLLRQEVALTLAASLPRMERDDFLEEADALQVQAEATFAELQEELQRHVLLEDERFGPLFEELDTAFTTFQSQREAVRQDLEEQASITAGLIGGVEEAFAAPQRPAITLTTRLENSLRALDPLVAQQTGVRQHVGMIEQLASSQHMQIAVRLATMRTLYGLDLDNIVQAQAQIESLWARMNDLARASVAFPELAPALQEAEEIFHQSYVATLSDIIDGRVSPDAYSFEEWNDLAVAALASLQALERVTAGVVAEIAETSDRRASTVLLVGVLVALLSILLIIQGFLMMRSRLVRPVGGLVDTIQEISRGNLDKKVSLTTQKDEIGQIAAALEQLRLEGLKAQTANAERLKEQEREAERARIIEQVARDFDASISDALNHNLEISQSVNGAANVLQTTAENVSRQSDYVNQSSEQATHNVQTVASSSEQLAASIQEINQQIEQSKMLSEEAVEKARETSSRVASLSESAARIDRVRQLITDIAEKTNLLALNAAIEAARAGDAGRGFNIVASEVKDLAKQTADATQEIDRQIKAMEVDTDEVVQGTGTIENFISRVNESITTIASAAEEQSAATGEISRSAQEAAAATRQVSDGMGEVRGAVDETHRMANDMLSLAEGISTQSERLREQFSNFLERVRTA
ncbi:MAG TPA: methyl-accepting chemotaxis protein [Kiloniellales bacterium]|nr:methyl-accepting chemotaxis protein [Kiloniellales bacterium]